MKKYEHIFFDLDGTLWDLYKNTKLALIQLFEENLKELSGVDFDHFYRRYHYHNEQVWALYRVGRMKKEVLRTERFVRSFDEVGLKFPTEFYDQFADRFLEICPALPHRVEGAMELLNHLKGKYHLHIITNGFKEVQGIKMKASEIDTFFEAVINSEDAGVKKPDPGIYQFALKMAGATCDNSIMIGDDWEADILGARDFGMDQAYLTSTDKMQAMLLDKKNSNSRHNYKPTIVVDDLHELINYF